MRLPPSTAAFGLRICLGRNPACAWIVHTIAVAVIALAALGAAALVIFALGVPLTETPDGPIHIHRTRALAEAIGARVFLPRIFPDFAFGYGYPVFNYYAPLSYYPAALAHLAGVALEPAVLAGAAVFLALSGAAMYAFLRVWASPTVAAVVAGVSLFAPYRLYNLSVRGALPEYAAFAWLPLIGLALAKLFSRWDDEGERGQTNAQGSDALYLTLLAASCTGLVLTHNLSAMMGALTLGVVGAAYLLTRIARLRAMDDTLNRWAIPAGFAALGVGLAAFYVLPALLEIEWVDIGQSASGDGFVRHLISGRGLFRWSLPITYPTAAEPTVPASGLFLAVNAALGLVFVAGLDGRGDRSLHAASGVSLLVSCVALILMTTVSAPVWAMGTPVLGKLQFPWRWLTIVSFSAMWGLALVLEWIRRRLQGRAVVGFHVLLAVGSAAFIWSATAGAPRASSAGPAGISSGDVRSDEALTVEGMWAFDDSHGQVGASWTGEFLPAWVRAERWTIGRPPPEASSALQRSPAAQHDAVAFVRPVHAGYLDTTYRVRTSEPVRLVFHMFYFPPWTVSVDGQAVDAFAVGPLGLLSFDAPAGEYDVDVVWAATGWVRAGWAAAASAWFAILGFLYLGYRRTRGIEVHRRMGVLLAAWTGAGVLVAMAWIAPARMDEPLPIGADYGSVQMEAAVVRGGQPGQPAQVDLTWFIAEAEQPLTTFVHIVDERGGIVAQDDGPLAGRFTPFERWLPGMVVTRRHWVPLPEQLPPGAYTALAGVYPSGAPDDLIQPELGVTETVASQAADAHGRVVVGGFKVKER